MYSPVKKIESEVVERLIFSIFENVNRGIYIFSLSFPAFRKYIGAFGNWHVYAFAHFGYQIQAISILSSIFMTVVRIVQNKWIKCADRTDSK